MSWPMGASRIKSDMLQMLNGYLQREKHAVKEDGIRQCYAEIVSQGQNSRGVG